MVTTAGTQYLKIFAMRFREYSSQIISLIGNWFAIQCHGAPQPSKLSNMIPWTWDRLFSTTTLYRIYSARDISHLVKQRLRNSSKFQKQDRILTPMAFRNQTIGPQTTRHISSTMVKKPSSETRRHKVRDKALA